MYLIEQELKNFLSTFLNNFIRFYAWYDKIVYHIDEFEKFLKKYPLYIIKRFLKKFLNESIQENSYDKFNVCGHSIAFYYLIISCSHDKVVINMIKCIIDKSKIKSCAYNGIYFHINRRRKDIKKMKEIDNNLIEIITLNNKNIYDYIKKLENNDSETSYNLFEFGNCIMYKIISINDIDIIKRVMVILKKIIIHLKEYDYDFQDSYDHYFYQHIEKFNIKPLLYISIFEKYFLDSEHFDELLLPYKYIRITENHLKEIKENKFNSKYLLHLLNYVICCKKNKYDLFPSPDVFITNIIKSKHSDSKIFEIVKGITKNKRILSLIEKREVEIENGNK